MSRFDRNNLSRLKNTKAWNYSLNLDPTTEASIKTRNMRGNINVTLISVFYSKKAINTLLAGREFRIGKTCASRGLANARGPYTRPRAKFFPIRIDHGRQITFLFLFLLLNSLYQFSDRILRSYCAIRTRWNNCFKKNWESAKLYFEVTISLPKRSPSPTIKL